jgi:hypothetical protein
MGIMGIPLQSMSRVSKDSLLWLMKKDVSWEWDDNCQAALDHLRTALRQAPTLAYPRYNKPFILYTDASTVDLKALLAQLDDNSHDNPVVYLSRALNSAGSNYTLTEMECLA